MIRQLELCPELWLLATGLSYEELRELIKLVKQEKFPAMHLVIDIRFYRPEPYGLAVYIRDLFTELVPLLEKQSKYSQITLIMDQVISRLDLSAVLPWWQSVQDSSKFRVYFSTSKYYSLKEQIWFPLELYRLRPDLTFFFNFNFPVLFPLPFVYQVLDLTIPKTKAQSPRLLAARLICQIGLRRAKRIVFLSRQTRADAEEFSGLNFTKPAGERYRPNIVVYNGINPKYLATPSAARKKAALVGLEASTAQVAKLVKLKTKLGITKKYFLFVSVWRKYKNVERLVVAFELFNSKHRGRYQLVIGGQVDVKYPEILARVRASPEYLRGNILAPGTLTDEEVILLQDGAEAYVFPSLSEGFGLTLLEAASRGTPVVCSDISIFREILPSNTALFFDPLDPQDISSSLEKVILATPAELAQLISAGYRNSHRYTWAKTAQQIWQMLESC